MVDEGTAALIARNRDLLATAATVREAAQEAIARAEDAVRSTMEIRLAWALMRQRLVASAVRRRDPLSSAD